MSIPKYHFYHGAALSLITDRGEFTGLARTSEYGAGAYAINHDRGLFIKHTTNENSPWVFNFAPEHQTGIRNLFNRHHGHTFIALVCGDTGICLMTYGEYAGIIDENFTQQQNVTVERPGGGGFRVRGRNGVLERVIPLNRYPTMIFE